MYINDVQRSYFYSAIGLDVRQFDKHVIRKTNQSAGTLFPVIYDTENPRFFELLENCAHENLKLTEIDESESSSILKTLQKLPSQFSMFGSLFQMFFLPHIETKYSWTE
jgi:magnesium-protoporphyrin IX monomethyl ester (oxidative) cyclase